MRGTKPFQEDQIQASSEYFASLRPNKEYPGSLGPVHFIPYREGIVMWLKLDDLGFHKIIIPKKKGPALNRKAEPIFQIRCG